MAIGDNYVPLQCSSNNLILDCNIIFRSKYGIKHLVVKDLIIVKEDYLNEMPENIDGIYICDF